MKINYIANVRIPTPRAHGYAIMKMCEQFSLSGAKVQLLIPDKKNNESETDAFSFYDIKRVFEIKKIPCIDLLAENINFGKLFYWIDFLSFIVNLLIRKVVQKNEVVYTRDFMIPLFVPSSSFICLELHDIPESNFLFNLAIKRPKLFFVLNRNLKFELVRRGVPENSIYIFGSGVQVSDFDININKEEAREKLGFRNDSKLVLYSGQFYSWKGIDNLGNAAKMLPEYHFLFIGGTEPELSRFKSEFENLKNVTIESFKERKAIPLFLKAADVLVIPQSKKEKISTHYSSPLKMLEYMASKRPIVASNLSSIRETLDEESAVFAEADDPKSLAFSIKEVLSDNNFAAKIADNAYKKVLPYAWDNRAKSILEIIKTNGAPF